MSSSSRFMVLLIHCLVASSLWAGTPADLTGVHRALVKCDRRHGTVSGPAHMNPCYLGFTHENSAQIDLVQNGNKVCGSHFACAGRNCNVVLSGEVVGLIEGTSVTLYSANGHAENGDAEVTKLRISSAGELLVPESRKHAFIKTSPGLISQKQRALCQPEFNPPVRLKNYELDIAGTRPDLARFPPKEKPTYHPPPAHGVTLDAKKTDVRIRDGLRVAGNLIPRKIWIYNTTQSPWDVSVLSDSNSQVDEACGEWLKSSENGAKSYTFAYSNGSPSEQVPPKSTRYTRLCAGDTLSLERTLPECPKFQCLRSCRC